MMILSLPPTANHCSMKPRYGTNKGMPSESIKLEAEADDEEHLFDDSLQAHSQRETPSSAAVAKVRQVPPRVLPAVTHLPQEDTFNRNATQPVNAMPPEILAQLMKKPAQQEETGVEARPSFTLTTSLPEEQFIKNPASKAASATFMAAGIGTLLGGLFGSMMIKLQKTRTGLAYLFGGGLGTLIGGASGLLLGATVLGKIAEQQQEMENKIHLAKTRILVEQLTPISLDPIQVKLKRQKKPLAAPKN